MPYEFLVGGARSGKSRLAQALAVRSGREVVFVATATAGDDEMEHRIADHRATRPGSWLTVEEPLDLRGALAGVDPQAFALVDCLTLWVTNLMERGDADTDIVSEVESVIGLMSARPGPGVVVSNEVGSGIVPATPLGRRFRDLLGAVNMVTADTAARSFLVVAGRGMVLQEPAPDG